MNPPGCHATMQLVRHIEHLKELPDFYNILLRALQARGDSEARAGLARLL
jgi:hypothetical protein